MPKQMMRLILCCLMMLALIGTAVAQAPVSDPVPDGPELTLEQLQQGKAAVDAATDLGEEPRRRLLETFEQTLSRFEQWQTVTVKLRTLERTLQEAPDRLADLREQREQLARTSELTLPGDSTLEEIETMIADRTARLAQAREGLRNAEAELSALLGGVLVQNEAAAAHETALAQVERELEAAQQESGVAAQILLDNLHTRKALYRSELALKRLQLANQGTLTALAQASRDLYSVSITRLGDELEQLEERAHQIRADQARRALEQADQMRLTLSELPRSVTELAEANRALRAELEQLVRDEQQVEASLQQVADELEAIRADFERIRTRVEVVGRGEALGKLLHARRSDLPSLQLHRSERQQVGESISETLDRQLEIDDLLRAVPERETAVRAAVTDFAAGMDDGMQQQLRAETDALLVAYRSSLQALQLDYGRHVNDLTTLDIAARERFNVAQEYVAYINEQLLWMPNAGLTTFFASDHALWGRWLSDTGNWQPMLAGWAGFVQRNLLLLVLVTALFLVLRRFNRAGVAGLQRLDAKVGKVRSDSTWVTLQAVFLLLLRALPWPLLLFVLGKVMQQFTDPFSLSLANGLVNTSLVLAYWLFVAQLIRPGGVAERHLNWSAAVCLAWRREMRWFIPFFSILTLLISVLSATEVPANVQAMGSVLFAGLMGGVFQLLRKLFAERGEVVQWSRSHAPQSRFNQLHFLWYPLVLSMPLLLALLSLGGYHYSATHLAVRLQVTVMFVFSVYFVMEIVLRWLFIAERRLRFEDALRRRDQLRAQRASEEKSGEESGDVIVVEAPEVNFESLSEQSRRLVRASYLFAVLFGTWAIWADLIPALAFLESTHLPFETTRLIDGVSTIAPMTLGDLLVGLFIIVVTFVAAKNLPGILEISLLQRLPLDPGARYAITALSQYLIAGVGLVVALKTIGFQWSGLQWLVAALGVGLGFGLQEIVANFVSGIILLFERPIRVGDVVTIDNTTGVVTRIQIRATTITNYDKQEFIVPNKEFITGRLINWTLTDKINRILLPVGLAYGADVDQALQLMREAAEEHPEVLKDPAPIVSFESFGNDALMLYLRAYLSDLDNRLGAITALHKSIYNKFNAAGLPIAFPQRDVHLDISHPLDIRLQRAPQGNVPVK